MYASYGGTSGISRALSSSVVSKLLPQDFRDLVSGPLRRYFLATLLWALGTGLTLSLSVVYIHNIRHFSIAFATILLTMMSICVMGVSPLIGTLVDRYGPSRILAVSVSVAVVGDVSWAFAHSASWIVISAALLTLSGTGMWGPSSVILARMAEGEQRQRAFGVNFMLVNLGIGAGGLVSASLVDLHNASTFTHLYLGNALLAGLYGVVLGSLWRHGQALTIEDDDEISSEGWRVVLKDRRLVHYVLASLLLTLCGYGSVEAGFSFFVVQNVHLPASSIGIVFFCNTATIVAAQLFILRFIDGKSRTRVLFLVGALWGASWLVIGFSAVVPHSLALLLLCGANVVFALGETLWSPVAPALVNDLAPEHLRGRYNSASGLTWSLAGSVSPLIAGLILGSQHSGAWPFVIGVGALGGGALALTLRRSLTPLEDGIREQA